MLHLNQTVIVEGKYDKAKLASLLDANIITTDGFDIFRDKAKLRMIRSLAAATGIVVLTDSDRAGFRIRQHLSGAIPQGQITHVYIPDLAGKERRKPHPGAEGLLGVEGVPDAILLEAFAKAGLTGEPAKEEKIPLTNADLVGLGLSGGENSHSRREKLLVSLGLPRRMGTKALLRTLNTLYSREAFLELAEGLAKQGVIP